MCKQTLEKPLDKCYSFPLKRGVKSIGKENILKGVK